jgi:primosomal protein N'
MLHRKELRYPPYVRLASIEMRYANELILDAEAEQISLLLHSYNERNGLLMTLLGPAPPLIHKVKNVFIRIIYLKGPDAHALTNIYAFLRQHIFKSSLFFTQHPLN